MRGFFHTLRIPLASSDSCNFLEKARRLSPNLRVELICAGNHSPKSVHVENCC